MTISVTSAPVQVPTGLRMTTGHFDLNGTSISAGGTAVTAAHFGGGSNGIPNRLPDFVIFSVGSSVDADATTSANIFRYIPATGKVTTYLSEPLSDEVGALETDDANNASADYLAVWVSPDPSGITTT